MEAPFDASHPFKGIVICCTSIPPDLRYEIAAKTVELGGIHRYDLTPDCTHLIVGDYDTPKYRHVAKERSDIKAMAAGWIEAVRNLWVRDADIDFAALEKEWQLRTFETGRGGIDADGNSSPRGALLCCITGIEDPDERQELSDLIEANGGIYTGDLTKRVTHLIAYKPEGRKYQAAKKWGLETVSSEWVKDSVERGMILEEKYYDPVLPEQERGVGAWNKERHVSLLGKRPRENVAAPDEGKRKLRKTASMKLNSQRDNLWGDILGNQQTPEPAAAASSPFETVQPHSTVPTQPAPPPKPSNETQGSKLSSFGRADDSLIFASCCFYINGFSETKAEVLINIVTSFGGLVCRSMDEVVSASGAQFSHRFLIVPQHSAAETHPLLPDNVIVITEFFIERCLHKKYFFDPATHVIGRPFPVFPIPGFENLSICTAGFTDIDLNQVDKSIRQLGAKYEQRFTPETSLLVCSSLLLVRKEKLNFALLWKVPVVSADWLWECISTGFNVPIENYMFPDLKQSLTKPKEPASSKEKGERKDKPRLKQDNPHSRGSVDQDLLPKPSAGGPSTKLKRRPDVDESAFAPAKGEKGQLRPVSSKGISMREETAASNFTTTFDTALTHQFATGDSSSSSKHPTPKPPPLSETSSNSLNKSPSSPRKDSQQPSDSPQKLLSRVRSEVADSDATEGDICQPSDLPALPEEASPESAQRRKDAEAEAERIAISKKLVSSLLDTPNLPATGGSDDTSAASSSNGGGTKQPRRRKREIMGRAISNVSAASSGSGGGGGGERAAPFGIVAEEDDNDKRPPATQLEYEDPQANEYKKQLLKKMLGTAAGNTTEGAGTGGGSKGSKGTSLPPPEKEKMTLAGMGYYDPPGGERRSSRRK
ncbi:putative S-M checkpoint control protein rad4 [Podospora australis]|uniref:S-M checkpoint control protein rad4 n=1 Tax=Podospora australis TaxID=1536484 RepID=A0AAN6WS40_9PEZI|nr:putative S-M checkpoint control protein rad4 [Podospora australis]